VEIFEIVPSVEFEIQMCRGCAGSRVQPCSPVDPELSGLPELSEPLLVPSLSDDSLVVGSPVELLDVVALPLDMLVVGPPVLEPESESVSPDGVVSSKQPHNKPIATRGVVQAFIREILSNRHRRSVPRWGDACDGSDHVVLEPAAAQSSISAPQRRRDIT
jgi:hypothetical protein